MTTTSAPSTVLVRYRDDGPLRLVTHRLPQLRVPAVLLVLVGMAAPVAAVVADARASVLAVAVVWALLVTGASANAAHERRLDWLAVVLLRAADYSVLAIGGLHSGPLEPRVFGLVAVVAFHHYDTVYRLRQRMPLPEWLEIAGLGWPGRLLLVLFAVSTDAGTAVYTVAIVVLGAMYVTEAALLWTRPRESTMSS